MKWGAWFQVYASGVIFSNLARPAGLPLRYSVSASKSSWVQFASYTLDSRSDTWVENMDRFVRTESRPGGHLNSSINLNEAQNELIMQHRRKDR